jgi:surface protein
MLAMFGYANSKPGNIANWDIDQVTSFTNFMISNAGLSTADYDAVLVSWENQLQAAYPGGVGYTPIISISFGVSKYTLGGEAEAARTSLINTYGWTITDGGGVAEVAYEYEFQPWSDNIHTITTDPAYTYNYNVTVSTGETFTNQTGDLSITFADRSIVRTLQITGLFPATGRYVVNGPRLKYRIINWGSGLWRSLNSAFELAGSLTDFGPTVPNLQLCTSMNRTFASFHFAANIATSNLNSWDVSNVTSMENCFVLSTGNQNLDISDWNTKNLTNALYMFSQSQFNGDITNWDVSSLTNASYMFDRVTLFNQNISSWNTSNVTTFRQMFYNTIGNMIFNQPIGSWNTSSATNMRYMLSGCGSFDQDISNWDINLVTDFTMLLQLGTLSTVNYDATLISWANQAPLTNKSISFGGSQYTPGGAAEAARNTLINTYGWTITDGGAIPDPAFIFEVDTEGSGQYPGGISYTMFTNPNVADPYNYNVETSDGQYITNVTGDLNLLFPTAGIYQIKVTGTFPSFYSGNTSSTYKLKDVINWGTSQWTSFYRSFYAARRMLSITATDAPNLSNVTDMREAFASAERLVSINNLGGWDVSNVTQMQQMFYRAYDFNEPGISSWNTANVTNMSEMFYIASDFNQSLSGWDTSSVTNMSQMFQEAKKFNGSLAGWNTSNVTNMYRMFRDANLFNQNIGSWDVSGVTNMQSMFTWAYAFNNGGSPDIGNWDISSVIDMSGMFSTANSFNQDLSNWDMSNVTNTASMFSSANSFNNGGSSNINNWTFTSVNNMAGMFGFTNNFNQPIGNWNTTTVVNMAGMFRDARAFNQDIGSWNVSNVTDMSTMFYEAVFNNGGSSSINNWNTGSVTNMRSMFSAPTSGGTLNYFNQPIGNWDVSSVTDMYGMFNRAVAFNQDISGWDVSNVTDMNSMFYTANAFNQDIGDWNISNVTVFVNFMVTKTPATYSAANLDSIYSKWSLLTVSPNELISFGSAQYTIAGGQTGRDILTGAPNNWTIIDGGGI